jgi:hypothetical protein
MSLEATGGPLARLAHAISTARQLTQNLRGRELPADLADKLAAHLNAAKLLVRDAKPGRKSQNATPSPKQKSQPGLRRRLWERDPCCFWCGRETRIDVQCAPDSATVEHLYAKRHPLRWHPRRQLPDVVLACAECNHGRGGYTGPETISRACPLVERKSTTVVYRLRRRA